MATGTTTFSGNAFKFDISYEYTSTSFKITSVKTTALISGWGDWELQPSLFLYVVKGSNPVPRSYQSYDANGTTCKQFVTDNGGVWQLAYNGNNPGAYLPNTAGTSATWDSSDFNNITLTLSGSSATVTIGAFIANTTGTLSNAAYGYSTISFTLYSESSAYELVVASVDTTVISVKHSWTQGSIAGSNYTERSIVIAAADGTYTEKLNNVASGTTMRFSGLIPNKTYNITGIANDGTTTLTSTLSKNTNVAQPSGITITTQGAESLVFKAESKNDTTNLKYKYILTRPDFASETKEVAAGQNVTFSSLVSNTDYNLQIIAYNTSTNITSTLLNTNIWTKPLMTNNGLVLKLPVGYEHERITITAVLENSSAYDQYSFKLDSNEYSGYRNSNTITYMGVEDNTNYEIFVMVKNTKSGLISDPISKNITTWHEPMTNLEVIMSNRWFWYLGIKSSYTYNGTISKYEFSIGDEIYQNRGANNSYSKGSAIGGNSINLKYNTNYLCKVRITDNHGRTYEASKTFKTLDERPLYVNGQLREVKLIRPDGTIVYLTPNLISVVNSDNKVTNMNDVINNDSRTSFS